MGQKRHTHEAGLRDERPKKRSRKSSKDEAMVDDCNASSDEYLTCNVPSCKKQFEVERLTRYYKFEDYAIPDVVPFNCPDCYYHPLEKQALKYADRIKKKKFAVWNEKMQEVLVEYTKYSALIGNWLGASYGLEALSMFFADRLDRADADGKRIWVSIIGDKKRPEKRNRQNLEKDSADEEEKEKEEPKNKITVMKESDARMNLAKVTKDRNEHYVAYGGVKKRYGALALIRISDLAAYIPRDNNKRTKLTLTQYLSQTDEPDEMADAGGNLLTPYNFQETIWKNKIVPPDQNACSTSLAMMKSYAQEPEFATLSVETLSKKIEEIQTQTKAKRRSSLGAALTQKEVCERVVKKTVTVVVKKVQDKAKYREIRKFFAELLEVEGKKVEIQPTLRSHVNIKVQTTKKMKRKELKTRINEGMAKLSVEVIEIKKKRPQGEKSKRKLREGAYAEEKFEKMNVKEMKELLKSKLPQKVGEKIHYQDEFVRQLPKELGKKRAFVILLTLLNQEMGKWVLVQDPGNPTGTSILRQR